MLDSKIAELSSQATREGPVLVAGSIHRNGIVLSTYGYLTHDDLIQSIHIYKSVCITALKNKQQTENKRPNINADNAYNTL